MTLQDPGLAADRGPSSNGDLTGVLAQLGERREQIARAQVLTVPVPRWVDPELKIRFHPVPHPILRRGQREMERLVEREKDSARLARKELDINADILINACQEIVAVVDGVERTVADGFTPELAVSLGLPAEAGARATCGKLFITEADMLATARQLSDWSGYRDNSSDEELAGES